MEVAKARRTFLVIFYICLVIMLVVFIYQAIGLKDDQMTGMALSIGGASGIATLYQKSTSGFLLDYFSSILPLIFIAAGSYWGYVRADAIMKNVKCPDCRSIIPKDSSVCKNCGCKLVKQ